MTELMPPLSDNDACPTVTDPATGVVVGDTTLGPS